MTCSTRKTQLQVASLLSEQMEGRTVWSAPEPSGSRNCEPHDDRRTICHQLCLMWKFCECLHVLTIWEAHVTFLGNSVIYISVAVRRLSRQQCDTYLNGSATLILMAVPRVSRRQCHACLGGSAMYISEAV